MPRYMVHRTFPTELPVPVGNGGSEVWQTVVERNAEEGGEKAIGLRNEESNVVAPIEATGSKSTAKGQRRVAQHLERRHELATVFSHEREVARARRGVVDRLRECPDH